MKESFEIPFEGDLSEVREGNKVTYQGTNGLTTVSVTTDDAVLYDELTVSKYRNAKVRIIVDIDHEDIEYKGVTP